MTIFQEKLHAVETEIRQTLPRLLKPTEGCYLRKINDDRPLKIIAEQHSTYFIYDLRDRAVFSKIKFKNLYDEYQIIGHDILLNDVLEWLEETRPNSNLTIELNRVSSIREGYSMTLFIQFDDLDCDWYLSKPHLKDQSKELIDFLYNLIKNEKNK